MNICIQMEEKLLFSLEFDLHVQNRQQVGFYRQGAQLHLLLFPCITLFREFVYGCMYVCVLSLLSVHLRAFGFRGGHCISSIA